jgi:hypothetical protein
MKKFSIFIPVLILIFSLTSAFVSRPALDPDLVWFQLNSSTGALLNPNNGSQSATDPWGCSGTANYCSKAFSISEGEVTLISGTTYSINAGVNINSAFNAEVKQN